MADFFLLGFLGGHPAEEPYITASRLASAFYFGFFIVILPLTSMLEQIIAVEMVTEHHETSGGSPSFPDKGSAASHRRDYYKLVEAIESDLKDLAIRLANADDRFVDRSINGHGPRGRRRGR